MDLDQKRRNDWYEFANHAFIEWRGITRKTVSDFAAWVGISQSLMSQQMRKGGKVPRDQRTISAWANRYGNRVYDILGLPIPEVPVDFLPEPLRSISREVRETLAQYTASGKSPDTGKILDEIMKKYGYETVISTKDRPSE